MAPGRTVGKEVGAVVQLLVATATIAASAATPAFIRGPRRRGGMIRPGPTLSLTARFSSVRPLRSVW